jgi:hypothetical protein
MAAAGARRTSEVVVGNDIVDSRRLAGGIANLPA